MKFNKLPNEFVINDELLDLEWIGELDSKQARFRKAGKKLNSIEFVFEPDEINNLINNLSLKHIKKTEEIKRTSVKESALVDASFFLRDEEEEILELGVSFNYSYV